jgi:hypothetical protein
MMTSPQANDKIRGAWDEYGGKLTAQKRLSSESLRVTKFKHEGYLGFCFEFPTSGAPEEARYGLTMIGPSDDWNTEERTTLPYRYFILRTNSATVSELVEWTPDEVNSYGAFLAASPPDFVNPILASCYGLDPNE